MTARRTYLWLLAGWLLLTLTLTSIPNLSVPVSFGGADKIAHAAFYGVMGLLCTLWRNECGATRFRAIAFALGFTVLVGAFDELHQQWIPGRTMEALDWIADAGGGAGGGLAAFLFSTVFRGAGSPRAGRAPLDAAQTSLSEGRD